MQPPQAPLRQICPFGHWLLDVQGTQAPFTQIWPLAHWPLEPQVQTPFTQPCPTGQAWPQPPQLFASVWMLTHTGPQAVWPEGQPPLHCPAAQV